MILSSSKLNLIKISDGAPGIPGKDGADSNQYTIHTNIEEILKFVNASISTYENKKYSFSATEIQMIGFDIKNQNILPNNPVEGNYNYADLDVKITNFNFKTYIKEENYADYVTKSSGLGGDGNSYFFNLQQLYDDFINGQLSNKIKDYILVDISIEEFNNNKTNYYIKNNNTYIQCTESSIYNENIDYYIYSNKDIMLIDITNFFNDQNSTDLILYGKIYENEEKFVNIEKYLIMKNGLSGEMLDFSINAGDFNAAIQNTGLVFNANGLTVTDGGFKIQATNNGVVQTVFSINNLTHQLEMNGTGRFSGDIYADNGYFNGEINSNTGSIGGFQIGQHSIISDDLELYSSYGNNESYIRVKNIKIGSGAEVEGSIKIGNLSLLNPQASGGDVLRLVKNENGSNVNYFTLNNNGDIIGNNWSIRKINNDVTATFDKLIAQDGEFNGVINARDGRFTGEVVSSIINASTINTANFVTEKTRSMGGAFVFKPTFEVLGIEGQEDNRIKIILANTTESYIPDYDTETGVAHKDIIIALSGKDIRYGKVISKALNNNKIELIAEFYSIDYSSIVSQSNDYNTITIFGYGNYNEILIGINSDNSYSGDIMPPRSLVMEEFTNLQNSNSGSGDLDYQIRLLLGDLSNAPQGNGYGLYADNVFLKGSLTTAGSGLAQSHNYAGINTLQEIPFVYNDWASGVFETTDYSNDKIIFWGGAASGREEDIKASPFIVTDNGNIFARSGEFKGSVISDSLITNTIIKAPVIYGNNNLVEEPSLKIYDTNSSAGGIGFYKKVGNIDEQDNEESDDILTLTLTNAGFSHYYYNQNEKLEKQFISFNENNNNIGINVNAINIGSTNLIQGFIKEGQNTQIQLNNGIDGIKLLHSNASISISSSEIVNNATTVTNRNSMIITNGDKTLKYTVNNGYYCLYVS